MFSILYQMDRPPFVTDFIKLFRILLYFAICFDINKNASCGFAPQEVIESYYAAFALAAVAIGLNVRSTSSISKTSISAFLSDARSLNQESYDSTQARL